MILESVFDLTGKLNEVEFRAEANPALHPGRSAAIYLKGERFGFVGVVRPELERKLDLTVALWCSNCSGTSWQTAWCLRCARFLRFPANRRDIAVVVAKRSAADILSECKKLA